MRPHVLILDNSTHPFMFRPHRHWLPYLSAAEVSIVNVPSGEPIPRLDGFSHLLLTGSEASIMEPALWLDVEAGTVREAAARGIPILGSCFGHQVLVYALSGPKHVKRSPEPEVGWIALDRIEEDSLFVDVPDPWHMFAYHFDEVVDLPSPWRILASTDVHAQQIIRYGDRPIWGIQPHPELSPAKARFFLSVFLLFAKRERRRLVRAMRRPSEDDRVMDRIVTRFLNQDIAN